MSGPHCGGWPDRTARHAESLDANEEELPENSRAVYRRLKLPDSEIRILLQHS
jgi:hypothetical protein